MANKSLEEKIKDKAKKKAKRKVKRKAKSYAKKKARKVNLLTVFICLVALVAGVAAGIFGYRYICRDDRFELRGKKQIAVELGAADFIYRDAGVNIIEFGRDISDEVVTETNMTDLGGGKYTVDTTIPGRYYIEYRVDSPKYGKVCRIRTFVVGGEG